MNNLLTTEQIQSLNDYITEKLRVRSIFVELKVKEVSTHNGHERKIELTSTKFNTVPVIHSPMEITDFGSSVAIDSEIKGIINVYVSVSARYEGNGVGLFKVDGSFRKNDFQFYSTNN